MAAGRDVCGPLLTWLQTFSPPSPCASPQDLASGLPLAHVLHRIDASWFHEAWLGQMRREAEEDWRLKLSNLQKVLQRIQEYWEQVLGSPLGQQHLPDLALAAGRGDPRELGRLLRLVLGCAVCCPGRAAHIQRIMTLEESVQLGVMAAIQELLGKDPPEAALAESCGSQELSEKDSAELLLAESCGSFDSQSRSYYFLSQEEPQELGGGSQQRCQELEQQVQELREQNRLLLEARGRLEAEAAGATARKLLALQAQVEQLQEENYRLESGREELQARCQQLEQEARGLQERTQELSSLAGEAQALRDEMETLRAASSRAAGLEAALAACRGRAAAAGELRRWGRALEELHGAERRRADALQAQLGRAQAGCQQLEAARRQLAALSGQQAQAELQAAQCRAELQGLQERFQALSQEKERLQQERDALREANEELRCLRQAEEVLGEGRGSARTLAAEILPAQLRETVAKLRQENLRLQAQRDQLQRRLRSRGAAGEEEELLEELKPPSPPPGPALRSLRSRLQEKEALIRHLESDLERSRAQQEREERLLVMAWSSMGLALQQQAERRPRGGPPGGAESFLAQQRRARTPRGRPPPPPATPPGPPPPH